MLKANHLWPWVKSMIKLVAFDVDGVMTDGVIYYSADGETLKAFHAHDGMGIKHLMRAGIEVAVLSGRNSIPLNKRLDDLGVKHRYLGCKDKARALQGLSEKLAIALEDMAFMGDDLIDLEAMHMVGLSMAPADAHPTVRATADFITGKGGGQGAVREAIDYIADIERIRLEDYVLLEKTSDETARPVADNAG